MLLDLDWIGVGVGDRQNPCDVVLSAAVGATRIHATRKMLGHSLFVLVADGEVLSSRGRRCVGRTDLA